MLDLARLEAGDVPIEQEVVDLGELAGNVAQRAEALAAERGVSVRIDRSDGILVVADRTLLEQALLVLIDNAIKYNREGGDVWVSVSVVADRAVVSVRDTGVGIDPQHLPRLGERFYRADTARTGEHSGAGLGIAIARTIAVRHSGSLILESDHGHGTTASLSLPAASA